jgi:hypothetical protein
MFFWDMFCRRIIDKVFWIRPNDTKVLVVSFYHGILTHGKQTLLHDSLGIIKKGALDKIEGPCPFSDPGLYRFKIETVDENKVIITELWLFLPVQPPWWSGF